MSSLVQAKCTNSSAGPSSASSLSCSLMKYSTALTSWLVVRSISLTRAACATLKSSARARRRCAAAGENGASSAMPGSAASASSHSISTLTRALIRPYSEKIGRSASTLEA